jgi:nucleoside-diphosphate-sugar epimerase
MNYILGASGTIGTAIGQLLADENVITVPRKQYLDWVHPPTFLEFLAKGEVSNEDTIFVCLGATNPQTGTDLLDLLNFQLPKTIAEVSSVTQCRVITFGSVFENFETNNNYLESKRKFFKSFNQQQANQHHKHFQLHTIYGVNKPKPHMFLGQIATSIVKNSTFHMSSGLQLREYWHALDVARVILELGQMNDDRKVIKISSGSPVQLKTLVLEVFRHFNSEQLLSLGSIPDPINENYDKIEVPEIDGIEKMMREPIRGVISYLEKYSREGVQ